MVRCIFIRKYAYIFSIITFIFINLLIYFDRGAIAANAKLISDTFKLSKFQEGAIPSCFMIGYMIFSPIFAQLPACIGNSKIIIIVGLIMWVLSCLVMMGSFWIPGKGGYTVLLIGRAIAGIGEAAFAPLAPTILDDISPIRFMTSIITIFYACIPVGVALGYGVAGGIGEYLGWQWVFLIQSILMAILLGPLVISSTKMHPTKRQMIDEAIARREQRKKAPKENFELVKTLENQKKSKNIFKNFIMLLVNPVYVLNVAGGTVYSGILGAMTYWGPSFFSEHLEIDLLTSNLTFSIISVVMGLVATWLGGFILSILIGRKEKKIELVKKRKTAYALLCCFICLFISIPIGLVAFATKNPYICFGSIAIGEFFLFMITSPMNVSLLSCVDDQLRDFSMSVNIFTIHLFGDFPSPSVVGIITDLTSQFTITMATLWFLSIIGVLLFFFAWIISYYQYRRDWKLLNDNSLTIMKTDVFDQDSSDEEYDLKSYGIHE